MLSQKIASLIFLSFVSFSAQAVRLLKKETLKKVLLPWVYRQYPDIQENLEQLSPKEIKSLAVQIAKVIAQSSAYKKASQKEKNHAEKAHVQMIEALLKKDQEQAQQKKKSAPQVRPLKAQNLTPVTELKKIPLQTELDPRQLWMEKRRAKVNEMISQTLENPTPQNLKKAQSIIDQALYQEMRLRSRLALEFPETVLLPNEDFVQIWQKLKEEDPQLAVIQTFWDLLKILVQLNEDIERDPTIREAALNKHWELNLPQKIQEECQSILKIYQAFRKKYGNMSELWNALLTSTALDLLKGKSNQPLSPAARKKLLTQLYRLEKFPQWSEELMQEFLCFVPESLASMNQTYQSLMNLKQKITQPEAPESLPTETLIFEYPTKVNLLKSALS